MNIRHDVDLSSYTTFGFEQRAARFVEVSTEQELSAAVQLAQQEGWSILALGGGSNLVFANDFPGLIIRQTNKLIHYSELADDRAALVTADAGVQWHSLVMDTVERGYTGLENLSLIPGQVGAAPVQNIGAYGIELCDRMVSLRALHLASGQWKTMSSAECDFSYRNSLFKQHDGEYIISKVTLRVGDHLGLHTRYSSLAHYLEEHYPGQIIDAKKVSDAVCAIRRSKLPDPAMLPNAGSFFHNPVLSADCFRAMQSRDPDIVAFRQSDGSYRLSAGWMIDRLGYKGFRLGGVGVHEQQALVLIKHGDCDAASLIELAEQIRHQVFIRFGVKLSVEPKIM